MGNRDRYFLVGLLLVLAQPILRAEQSNIITENGIFYATDKNGNKYEVPKALPVEEDTPKTAASPTPQKSSNGVEVINGKEFLRLDDGTLLAVTKAEPVVDDANPTTKTTPLASPAPSGPQKSWSNPEAYIPDFTKDESAAFKEIPLEKLEYETQEDEASAESLPLVGFGAAIVGVGIMLAKRIYYLRNHPGAVGNEAIQSEIKRYDGMLAKINRIKDLIGIEARIVGNKVELSLKKVRDKVKQGIPLISKEKPEITPSQIENELKAIALEWEKNNRDLDRLEDKVYAELLRRRAETFTNLDAEYAALTAKEKEIRALAATDKVSAEIREAHKRNEAEHRSAELETRNAIIEHRGLELALERTLAAINGNSAPTGKLATHPIVQEHLGLLDALQKEAAVYRKLKFDQMKSATPNSFNEEIAASEEKLKALREQATKAVTKSAEEPLRLARIQKDSAYQKLSLAKDKHTESEKSYNDAITAISEKDKTELGVLKTSKEEIKKQGAYLASLDPRVIAPLSDANADQFLNPTQKPDELTALRSEIALARLTQNEDMLQQKAAALHKLADQEVKNNLARFAAKRDTIVLQKKSRGIPDGAYGYWMKHLMEHTQKELGYSNDPEILRDEDGKVLRSVKTTSSDVFENPETFMRLLAGENIIAEEDAKKVRAIASQTLADLEIEMNGDKPKQTPWYRPLHTDSGEMADFYYIMRDVGAMAEAGQQADSTRDLARAKETKANELAQRRINNFDDFSAANATKKLADAAGKTHALLTGPTSRTLQRHRANSGSSGCLVQLRQRAALF